MSAAALGIFSGNLLKTPSRGIVNHLSLNRHRAASLLLASRRATEQRRRPKVAEGMSSAMKPKILSFGCLQNVDFLFIHRARKQSHGGADEREIHLHPGLQLVGFIQFSKQILHLILLLLGTTSHPLDSRCLLSPASRLIVHRRHLCHVLHKLRISGDNSF